MQTMKVRSRRHGIARLTRGSILLEVSIGLALTAFIAVASLRQSMLALSAGQWASMQALTDAYLTRETALASRLPFDQLREADFWPPQDEAVTTTVGVGSIANPVGGPPISIEAQLTRSSQLEAMSAEGLPTTTLLRLDSVLKYQIGGQAYLKTRSTLRTQ
jgi:hypothetical protein